MAATVIDDNGSNRRREYLVTFRTSRLGEALRTFTDRGITREIRCYPGRRLMLLQEELDALHDEGVFEEEAIPVKYKL